MYQQDRNRCFKATVSLGLSLHACVGGRESRCQGLQRVYSIWKMAIENLSGLGRPVLGMVSP